MESTIHSPSLAFRHNDPSSSETLRHSDPNSPGWLRPQAGPRQAAERQMRKCGNVPLVSATEDTHSTTKCAITFHSRALSGFEIGIATGRGAAGCRKLFLDSAERQAGYLVYAAAICGRACCSDRGRLVWHGTRGGVRHLL